MASDPSQLQDHDAGEWKPSSTKESDKIPPLGSNILCCSCKYCKAVLKETSCWTKAKKGNSNVDIKIGDRVLIQKALPGVVKYIGDLDSNYTNGQVYVGVKLDDPVGQHDGVFQNKRFFECPNMHGVIVPIEDVHLLVPADGRTITVNKNKPAKFLSMPHCSDLETLTSSMGESRGDCETEEAILHTMSEGRLPTPLPKFKIGATPPCTEKVPYNSQEFFHLEKMLKQRLCNEDGVTRSGMFICDFPGSIAAEITESDPDSAIKEKLLKSLSQHCDNIPVDDVYESGVDDKVEEVIVLQDNGSKQSVSQQNAIKAPPCTPVSSGVHAKSPARGLNQPLSASADAVFKSRCAKISVVGGSKSANIDLKKVGTPSPHISKLATSKVTAPVLASTTEPVQNCTEESSMVEKQASVEDKKSQADKIEYKQCRSDNGANADSSNAPMFRILRLSDSLSCDDLSELSEKCGIDPATSYTSQLISGLPWEDIITPQSGDAKMNDMIEFRKWVEKWGGGTKGWAKAQTLQKLKEAQRKGQKELEWQRNIDRHEKDERYAPRIRNIRKLRNEIMRVRERRKPAELKIQEYRTQLTFSSLCTEIDEFESQTMTLRDENESLLKKVLGHPLFDLVEEALQYIDTMEIEEDSVLIDDQETELHAKRELFPNTKH